MMPPAIWGAQTATTLAGCIMRRRQLAAGLRWQERSMHDELLIVLLGQGGDQNVWDAGQQALATLCSLQHAAGVVAPI